MAKSILTPEQILGATQLVAEIPDMVKRLGKDGKQIEAFYQDIEEKLKTAKTDEDKVLIISSLILVLLKFRECAKKISLWGDPMKPFRIKCDDVARVLDLKRYKALRNL